MNLKILKKVEKGKDYELKKSNPKKNIIPPFLKRNFKIRVPRRNNKHCEILILRRRNRE